MQLFEYTGNEGQGYSHAHRVCVSVRADVFSPVSFIQTKFKQICVLFFLFFKQASFQFIFLNVLLHHRWQVVSAHTKLNIYF